MGFPFLTVFVVFVIFLAIRYRTITKNQFKHINDYWERDARSNRIPAVDLASVTYLIVPADAIPYGVIADEDVASIEQSLQEISGHKLLNLNGMDNAAIKETYGTANFETMLAFADEFDQFQMLLVDYAKALIEHDCIPQAIQVLEYGVSIGSDISSNYTLLGDCYVTAHTPEKIHELKEKLQQLHLLLEPSICSYLDSLE